MSSSIRSCFLRCLKNPQKIINLPHKKSIMIGRNETTGITDTFVSRNHLECIADYDTETVTIQTLGRSHSGCNGYALMKNSKYTLKNSDQIEVRLGYHEYEIVFEKSVNNDNLETESKRIKIDVIDGKWEQIDGNELLIYTSDNCHSKSIIAAFDLDGTLIKTKSGARFPKDLNDWQINFPNVPKKLQQLYNNGQKIVIFTNQYSLGKDSSKIADFKLKIEEIIKHLLTPCQVFVATGRSIYRKPAPGMWNILKDMKNNNMEIDLEQSFYVGDAAGREHTKPSNKTNKKKDHSNADRLFALNIGVNFQTPEEYFLNGHSTNFKMPEFDPRNLPNLQYPDLKLTHPEMIIMVGFPGSGKTYFTKNFLLTNDYIHINRDKLGNWNKCVKLAEESLRKKQSVVIDNTNPDKETRQRYIDVAKKFNIRCRCFVMKISFQHVKHNNRFRELTDKSHTPINEMVLNTYKKNYQEPEISEGFVEILHIPFVAKFNNNEDEKLYKMFLLEN